MLREGDAAGGTLHDRAACCASHAWREPATIEEDDRLMTGIQALADRGMKRAGKKRVTGWPFAVAAGQPRNVRLTGLASRVSGSW